MGARNVGLVFAHWSHLPHRAHRLLLYMAFRTHDAHDPAVFWGGREDLALALGSPVPDGRGDVEKKKRQAVFESVRAAVSDLVKAGAIVRIVDAKPGRNAEYELILHPRMVQGDPVSNGAGKTWPMVQENPGEWYRLNTGMVQGHPVPKEYRTTEEHTEEPVQSFPTPTQVGSGPAPKHGRKWSA